MIGERRVGRLEERKGETMVARSGETTWSTKLERIAMLAASNKELVFNNLAHVIDIGMLREMYRQLDGKKAVGTDGVSKEAYGKCLDANLREVLLRIQRGTYKPKAARMVEIPKEDGSFRPLAISCIEDKVVQSAVNKILCAIFEPLFLPCSYGFRPKRDCHQALRALQNNTYQNQDGAVIEIDVRKYFNSIPHGILHECLGNRISDKRFLKLINTLIKTPTMVDGKAIINEIGCPQGSICSPVISNIYLHYVIDIWFEKIGRTHMKGRTSEVRFADDMVFIFQKMEDAERFYKVLPKRLSKFGLELHLDKSQLVESGNKAAIRAERNEKRLGNYLFLGFMCYWGKAKKGFWRLKFASRGDRFIAKLKGLRKYLWENRNSKTSVVLDRVVRILRGWINYHGISDNQGRVWSFIHRCQRLLFSWFNHRGGKRRMNWKRFTHILKVINFPEKWKTKSMFLSVAKQV